MKYLEKRWKKIKTYDVNEVAMILKVHSETVKNEIKRGKIKAVKVGNVWRIPEQSVEEYLGIIANDYKTERELQLEKENGKLQEKISMLENTINSIKNELLKL